jgi:hypothetical protein
MTVGGGVGQGASSDTQSNLDGWESDGRERRMLTGGTRRSTLVQTEAENPVRERKHRRTPEGRVKNHHDIKVGISPYISF